MIDTRTLPPPEQTKAAAPAGPVHLSEIHGLRGMALVLVVLFHLFGNGRVSGGVDVFLVVSGFLVTGSLVRRAERGQLRLGAQYARSAWRLIPSALVVLATVAVATWYLLPKSRWLDIWEQVLASGLYVENWNLITNQLAYGAAGPAASPLQHFWSLSVQGQFLLAWPIVVLLLGGLAYLVGRATRTPSLVRITVLVVALAITAASFAYAVHLVAIDQQVAYFHSLSRVWELGVGAVLALVAPVLRLPRVVQALAGWGGLALVVSSGFLFDGASLYPGVWTWWPVAGAALVILGAGTTSVLGPRRTLEWGPLRFLADISYELYLWHWPILIFFLAIWEPVEFGVREAATVLAASLLLAWVTRMIVARPAARLVPSGLPRWRAFGALVTAVAVTAAVLVPTSRAIDSMEREQAEQLRASSELSPEHPGAAVLTGGSREGDALPDVPFRPTTDVAALDRGKGFDDGCFQEIGPLDLEAITCTIHEPADPTQTVLIVGGSHEVQWEPALKVMAEVYDWKLVQIGKAACRLTLEDGSAECRAWSRDALDAALAVQADMALVVTTDVRFGKPERVLPGQVDMWQRLSEAGTTVVGVRDNPRFPHDPVTCVEEEGPDSASCPAARAEMYDPTSPVQGYPGVPSSMVQLDLTDAICGPVVCEPVIGNVLVYMDDDHVNASYVRTMVPVIEERLRAQAAWLFRG